MTDRIPTTLSTATDVPWQFSPLLQSSDHANIPAPLNFSRRFPPNFPSSLSILPFTSSEWSRAVADVKKDYISRRFRPCVARCNEILNNLRDKTLVQPVYLIYLHFYAASSQESMARALHHASSQRLKLLHQAREHYCKAAQLIAAAADAVPGDRASRRGSVYGGGDSTPTSARASGVWTPSLLSESSSRATSISSVEDACVSARKPTARRGSCQSTASVERRTVIVVDRPDSPTLGLSPLASSSFQDLLNAMPSPPPGPVPVAVPAGASTEAASRRRFSTSDPERPDSTRRFCALLADLQSQITRHLTFVEADLVAARNPPPATPTNLGLDDNQRRYMELQPRIEKLRAGGWQRRRFDASRYEELREGALADIYS